VIVAAETLATRKVFTIDRKDFAAYRGGEATVTTPSKSFPGCRRRTTARRGTIACCGAAANIVRKPAVV
jgi:hypothetical protein